MEVEDSPPRIGYFLIRWYTIARNRDVSGVAYRAVRVLENLLRQVFLFVFIVFTQRRWTIIGITIGLQPRRNTHNVTIMVLIDVSQWKMMSPSNIRISRIVWIVTG